MADASGVAEAMLGLDGFRVLGVQESAAEVLIRIETSAELVGGPGCGVVATAHDRMAVANRDLAAFGRRARLVWCKRRWRCEERLCSERTGTEPSPQFSARCLLSNRAVAVACRQVGRNCRPVAQMADALGVCWQTVMSAVRAHGEPRLDDPGRVGVLTTLGVDETTFLAAREHPTLYASGLVDREATVVIDVIGGKHQHGSWAPGSIGSPGGGSARSAWWPRTWPSPIAPGSVVASITRSGSPTPSTS